MIPSFPKRMTGPIPAGGGTGIFLRFTAQGPAGERIQFVSPRLRGNFLFSSLRDYCIIKYGTGRAVVPALFRVDNPWGPQGRRVLRKRSVSVRRGRRLRRPTAEPCKASPSQGEAVSRKAD